MFQLGDIYTLKDGFKYLRTKGYPSKGFIKEFGKKKNKDETEIYLLQDISLERFKWVTADELEQVYMFMRLAEEIEIVVFMINNRYYAKDGNQLLEVSR